MGSSYSAPTQGEAANLAEVAMGHGDSSKKTFKVRGCPTCRSLRATSNLAICLYCGQPMTTLHAAFTTLQEAKRYIDELKKAETEDLPNNPEI